jgi:hypothetical protein
MNLDYDEEEAYDEAFSDGYDAGKRYSIAYTKMLEERVSELKKALEPFAERHKELFSGVMQLPAPDEHSVLVEYLYLRKAREALEGKK